MTWADTILITKTFWAILLQFAGGAAFLMFAHAALTLYKRRKRRFLKGDRVYRFRQGHQVHV